MESIMRLSIEGFYMKLSIEGFYMTLSTTTLCQYSECNFASVLHFINNYAECRYAEGHYAECHYAECHYADNSTY